MYKFIKQSLLLLLILTTTLIWSQKEIKRVVDKKIHIPQALIDGIKDNHFLNTINLTKRNQTSVTQLTNDNIDDHELHAAINPTNQDNIIVGWMNFDSSNTTMPLVFKLFYTTDMCNTWQTSTIDFVPHNLASNELLNGGGDPVIAFDYNGNAYISWIYTIIRIISSDPVEVELDMYLTYAKSTDNGATWVRAPNNEDYISSGVISYDIPHITGVVSGNFPDKQWMAVQPGTNDLFCSLTEFNPSGNYNTGIDTWGIRRKPNNQTIFEPKVLVPPTGTVWASLGTLAFNSNGDIHAVYPYYPAFPNPPLQKLVHVVSTDNGLTYSTPNFIADVDVTNFQGVGQTNNTLTGMYNRLYPASHLAIDNSGGIYDGRIYTVWNTNDPNRNKRVEVLLSYSDDNGSTWSTPANVYDDDRNYGFQHRPSIFVNDNGDLILSWYDNRDHSIPNVYRNDYYIAVSTDGSQTFSELKATSTPLDYNGATNGFNNNIGEYYQVVASDDTIVAFYTNYDGNDTEIYYKKVAINEVLSIDDSAPITDKVSFELKNNPVNDEFTLVINAKEHLTMEVLIYSINGKLVKKFDKRITSIGATTETYTINSLNKNTYFVNIKTPFGDFTKKLIKN